MYIPFEEMPSHARVWVYQSDKQLSDQEVNEMETQAQAFVNKWTAHGANLKSSAKVFYNRFLVLSVDEDHASASGCSIDSSVRFIKTTEQNFGIDFFNRTLIAFLKDNNIVLQPMSKLKDLVAEGAITHESITFNNLVSTAEELRSSWRIPSSESWLVRYF